MLALVVLFLAFPKFPADGKQLIKIIFDLLNLKDSMFNSKLIPQMSWKSR